MVFLLVWPTSLLAPHLQLFEHADQLLRLNRQFRDRMHRTSGGLHTQHGHHHGGAGGGHHGGSGSGGGVGGGGGGGSAGGAAGLEMVLEEEYDPDYEPSSDEILEYAQFLGMDLDKDRDLFWIAREGLKAPLPEPWKPCKTDENDIYYFNFTSGDSVWEHPCDEYYRNLYQNEKKKKLNSLKNPLKSTAASAASNTAANSSASATSNGGSGGGSSGVAGNTLSSSNSSGGGLSKPAVTKHPLPAALPPPRALAFAGGLAPVTVPHHHSSHSSGNIESLLSSSAPSGLVSAIGGGGGGAPSPLSATTTLNKFKPLSSPQSASAASASSPAGGDRDRDRPQSAKALSRNKPFDDKPAESKRGMDDVMLTDSTEDSIHRSSIVGGFGIKAGKAAGGAISDEPPSTTAAAASTSGGKQLDINSITAELDADKKATLDQLQKAHVRWKGEQHSLFEKQRTRQEAALRKEMEDSLSTYDHQLQDRLANDKLELDQNAQRSLAEHRTRLKANREAAEADLIASLDRARADRDAATRAATAAQQKAEEDESRWKAQSESLRKLKEPLINRLDTQIKEAEEQKRRLTDELSVLEKQRDEKRSELSRASFEVKQQIESLTTEKKQIADELSGSKSQLQLANEQIKSLLRQKEEDSATFRKQLDLLQDKLNAPNTATSAASSSTAIADAVEAARLAEQNRWTAKDKERETARSNERELEKARESQRERERELERSAREEERIREQNRNEELKRSLSDANTEIARLKAELTLRDRDLSQQRSKLDAATASASMSSASVNAELSRLRSEASAWTMKEADLNRRLELLEAKSSSKINELNQFIEARDRQIKSLSVSVAAAASNTPNSNAQTAAVMADLSTAQRERDELKTKYETLHATYDRDVTSYTAQIAMLQEREKRAASISGNTVPAALNLHRPTTPPPDHPPRSPQHHPRQSTGQVPPSMFSMSATTTPANTARGPLASAGSRAFNSTAPLSRTALNGTVRNSDADGTGGTVTGEDEFGVVESSGRMTARGQRNHRVSRDDDDPSDDLNEVKYLSYRKEKRRSKSASASATASASSLPLGMPGALPTVVSEFGSPSRIVSGSGTSRWTDLLTLENEIVANVKSFLNKQTKTVRDMQNHIATEQSQWKSDRKAYQSQFTGNDTSSAKRKAFSQLKHRKKELDQRAQSLNDDIKVLKNTRGWIKRKEQNFSDFTRAVEHYKHRSNTNSSAEALDAMNSDLSQRWNAYAQASAVDGAATAPAAANTVVTNTVSSYAPLLQPPAPLSGSSALHAWSEQPAATYPATSAVTPYPYYVTHSQTAWTQTHTDVQSRVVVLQNMLSRWMRDKAGQQSSLVQHVAWLNAFSEKLRIAASRSTPSLHSRPQSQPLTLPYDFT